MTDARARRLHARLLEWYGENRRDLPWRRTRDPYAIWISEAMLQQTRVEAVVGYWTRFMARFPTVHHLAAASEEDVLSLWSGLGYYRRARALREAARVLVREYAGELPRTAAEMKQLPGVGPYTAGAVLSIAFDLPEAVVDGNIERVFARMFHLEGRRSSAELKRAVWKLARHMVPARGAGDWNQALMELGATLCLPRAPRCDTCPWARACAAKRAGVVEDLPGRSEKQATVDLEIEMLLVERGGEVLLERRAEDGAMAGMWQLPTRVVGKQTSGLFPGCWPPGAVALEEAEWPPLRHSITHHRIRASVRRGRLRRGVQADALAWHASQDLDGIPLTGLSAKALRRVLAG